MVIKIDQDRLFEWLIPGLIATGLALVLLDAVIAEYEMVSIGAAQRLFNITREDGLPNFFSSFQMLSVSVVLLLITLVVKGQTQGANPKLVWGWGVITALFFYMGLDDATKLHERLGTIFSTLVESDGTADPSFLGRLSESFPSYAWQLFLGPIVAAAGLFVVIFLMRQLPALRLKLLVWVAIGLWVTAVGMDFVEGMDSDFMDDVADFFGTFPGRAVHFSKSIEEFLEMVGTTIFMYVFLKTLMHTTPSITFEFDRP